ncbi:hypothetical protein DPMN_010166 [Dreissena polymorpha]|uniref:Uncharacterized protein n=1 Tax=Dreissena polymorpha TaxID=45954 RepID=A0A9D4N1P2_DREPO|nr:hypothetical protein DPMN_010166 [Dreissena polymorpha]
MKSAKALPRYGSGQTDGRKDGQRQNNIPLPMAGDKLESGRLISSRLYTPLNFVCGGTPPRNPGLNLSPRSTLSVLYSVPLLLLLSLFRLCNETTIHLQTITIPLGDPSKIWESAGEEVQGGMTMMHESTIHLQTITIPLGSSSESCMLKLLTELF